MSQPGPVTMTDVAAAVGVSIATVSRALSGNRPMSPELRERVLAAAEELGCSVNLVGRALRRRRKLRPLGSWSPTSTIPSSPRSRSR